VLEADSEQPHQLDNDDVDFLTVFAGFLGAAIGRRLYDDRARANAIVIAKIAEEHDLLLQELQHRVKNNLQAIMSIISLQQRDMDDGPMREALARVSNRVVAIAMSQDQLAVSKSIKTVRLGGYLRALSSYLTPERTEITIAADIADADAPSDQATPVGLILNEAITNAVKHAFPDRPGMISVRFSVEEPSRVATLVISDDGVGGGDNVSGGSGSKLMKALAQQINATLEESRSPQGGVMIKLRFALRA
jgi:two-component sensor histidine kinase